MLFKLSLKNIKKSIKDYAIYFFTLILGVAIFYVFNSMESQTAMMNISKSTFKIIELMMNVMSFVSVFVSVVLGFLIIYASRFLMKRRSKEFGIYLTLGMSKRKISTILFVETLLIGILSLLVGLGVGIFASQAMSIVVANMFEADLTNFKFVFSSEACIKTMIYFGIMYFIVMIFNTISVSKTKLIDLLQHDKMSESIKTKNPAVCIIVFVISVILLGYAYYSVTVNYGLLNDTIDILVPIVLGCVTTYTIVWSISGLMLRLFSNMKNVYYKGLNSFTLRQISSKINTTVFSITIICLMLFITICSLSSSISLKNSLNKGLAEMTPVDVEIHKAVNESNKSIYDIYTEKNIDLNDYLKDIVEFKIYRTKDFTLGSSLGDAKNEVEQQYPFMVFEDPETIVTISDYNKIAKLFGKQTFSLENNEYIIIGNYKNMVEIRNIALKEKNHINILGNDLLPKYNEVKDGFISLSSNNSNTGVFIVPDTIVNESMLEYEEIVANYKSESKDEKQKIENIVVLENIKGVYYDTKNGIRENSVGLSAVVTFVAIYLGIIFLISSASLLALKELSEASDNKLRFNMLRKIGVDEKDLNKALLKQIGIFFLFPLILAIIHSIFGIKFAMIVMAGLGEEKLYLSIIMTGIFLVFIYGGYFLITYFCSKNIIKENNL